MLYRCAICNVTSASARAHNGHLKGKRHMRNEEATLQRMERADMPPTERDPPQAGQSKRARHDAAAVESACAILDAMEHEELEVSKPRLPTLEEHLLSTTKSGAEDPVTEPQPLPPRFRGDVVTYCSSWRSVLGDEARAVLRSECSPASLPIKLSSVRINAGRIVFKSPPAPADDEARVSVGTFLQLHNRTRGDNGASSSDETVLAVVEQAGPDECCALLGPHHVASPLLATGSGALSATLLPHVGSILRADAALRRLLQRVPDASPPSRAIEALIGDGWVRNYTTIARAGADLTDALVATSAAHDPVVAEVLGASESIVIMHGPPGSGKTSTLAQVLMLAKHRSLRVLAVAASNRAVAELCDRFTSVSSHLGASGALVVGARAAICGTAEGSYCAARSTAERERLLHASTIFCTLATAGRPDLRPFLRCSLVVVDEAGQATEPEIMTALEAAQIADKLVLCGDPIQLPPAVTSLRANARGLALSAMGRLLANFKEGERACAYTLLSDQYRMCPSISRFPSDTFYGGHLKDSESVRARETPPWALCTLQWSGRPVPLGPRALLSVESGREERDGTSLLNRDEASVAVLVATRIIESASACGSGHLDLAILSFYAAQVELLRELLKPTIVASPHASVRIGTVDSFQGSEACAVILSCVRAQQLRPLPQGWIERRSRSSGDVYYLNEEDGATQWVRPTCAGAPVGSDSVVGFLSDAGRLNVALTRARHVLVILTHVPTLERAAEPHVTKLVADSRACSELHVLAG